ncbi:MAG: hypothetical protein J3K34DRAFT_470635 [Monoraphidium minutum]|nr:MAG: hypothetical protein J3K34DRAFT_470635 [Monoraphidium minutum]
MGDQRCTLHGGDLCPPGAYGGFGGAAPGGAGAPAGGEGAGAPLWVQPAAPKGRAAAALAAAEGLPGYRPRAAGAAGAAGAEPPAAAAGVVSRHSGECAGGADCVNLAAALDRVSMAQVRYWVLA